MKRSYFVTAMMMRMGMRGECRCMSAKARRRLSEISR